MAEIVKINDISRFVLNIRVDDTIEDITKAIANVPQASRHLGVLTGAGLVGLVFAVDDASITAKDANWTEYVVEKFMFEQYWRPMETLPEGATKEDALLSLSEYQEVGKGFGYTAKHYRLVEHRCTVVGDGGEQP